MFVFDPTKSESEQLEDARLKLEALARMVESPGWKLYEEYLLGEEQRLLADLSKVQTGEQALRAAVAYGMLSKIRSLPVTVVQQGLAQLAQTKG